MSVDLSQENTEDAGATPVTRFVDTGIVIINLFSFKAADGITQLSFLILSQEEEKRGGGEIIFQVWSNGKFEDCESVDGEI